MTISRILTPAVLALALAAPVAAANPASAADPTLLTYSQKRGTVDLLTINDSSQLRGVPTSFRQFAKASLRASWKGYWKGRPACKGVPEITVTALRTDGFAFGNAGDHPQPGCQGGGGYQAIWAIRQGAWKQVIGTQDVPTCQRLERFDIPSEIGVDQCYDGTKVVDYTHA